MISKFIELLELSVEQVFELHLPSMADIYDLERLKRIIYSALAYLRQQQRSQALILEAWQDVYYLYNWFFQLQEQGLRDNLQNKIGEDDLLIAHTELDSYLLNEIESLKSDYISEVDVIDEILQTSSYGSLYEISGVTTDFSNVEFFCVLALHFAANAIESLVQTTNSQLSDLQCFKAAYNATLEAQVAIDAAHYHHQLTASSSSDVTQSWITMYRRSIAKKSHLSRYGDRHQRRRDKAWQLFNEMKKQHPDWKDSNIIAAIVDPLQSYSDEIDLKRFKVGSEIDSIYRIILSRRKEEVMN